MTMYDNNSDPRRTGMRDARGFGWGIPLAIVAAILIIGGLFFMNSGTRSTTASSDRPAATNSGPAPAGAPVPGPTSTNPAPNR
jgi:hypothetical protein